MSNMNRIIPLVIVTGVGIWNGMYVFEPAFKEQKEQREKTFDKQHGGSGMGGSQELGMQESDAKTPSANPAGGQKDALAFPQQLVASKDASGSSSWLKSWGLAWPGSKATSEAEQLKHDASNPIDQRPSTPRTQEQPDN